MKKKIYLILLLFLSIFTLTGCDLLGKGELIELTNEEKVELLSNVEEESLRTFLLKAKFKLEVTENEKNISHISAKLNSFTNLKDFESFYNQSDFEFKFSDTDKKIETNTNGSLYFTPVSTYLDTRITGKLSGLELNYTGKEVIENPEELILIIKEVFQNLEEFLNNNKTEFNVEEFVAEYEEILNILDFYKSGSKTTVELVINKDKIIELFGEDGGFDLLNLDSISDDSYYKFSISFKNNKFISGLIDVKLEANNIVDNVFEYKKQHVLLEAKCEIKFNSKASRIPSQTSLDTYNSVDKLEIISLLEKLRFFA